jgi:hypothetical protein
MSKYFRRPTASPKVNVAFVRKEGEALKLQVILSLDTLHLHGLAVYTEDGDVELGLGVDSSEDQHVVADLDGSMSDPGVGVAATLVGEAAEGGYLIFHAKWATAAIICNI